MKIELVFPLLLTGCVVTDVGNPQTEPKTTDTPVEFRAYDSSLPNALTLAAGVNVTHAWVTVDEFEAKACDPNAMIDGIEVEEIKTEPFIVDLISGQSYPKPVTLLSEIKFCEISMEFKPATEPLPGGVPLDMSGLSVMIRAVRNNGTPIEIRGDFSDTLKLKGEVNLRDMDSFFVAFAANEWFVGPEFQELNEEEEDAILIDANTNADAYEEFRRAFKRSSGLFRDKDRDGELDNEEEKESLAEPEEDD